jgi:hypothetical protein
MWDPCVKDHKLLDQVDYMSSFCVWTTIIQYPLSAPKILISLFCLDLIHHVCLSVSVHVVAQELMNRYDKKCFTKVGQHISVSVKIRKKVIELRMETYLEHNLLSIYWSDKRF